MALKTMRFSFITLTDKKYSIDSSKYKIDWNARNVSKFQFDVKSFFKTYWQKDYCCEEFPCIVKLTDSKLRFDIINLTRKIVVEANHDQHFKYNKFFHGKKEDFLDKQLVSDRKKELWCEKNKYTLIEIYPSNMPIKLNELLTKYGNICY